MNPQIHFKRILMSTLLTLLPTLGMAAGPSNGGGGFQYPNSRALLKKVTTDLSAEILQADSKVFSKLPPEFSREEIARIIRDVKARPDQNKVRTNADGEEEGLMFDYSSSYCEVDSCVKPARAIIAEQAFFDTYRALPMKQLAEKKFDDNIYKLTEKDVRQRLLHELAHLLKIGTRNDGKDDSNGDVFAERFLRARNLEYVRCDSRQWEIFPMRKGSLLWFGLMLHRPSGKVAFLIDSYQTDSYTADKDDNLILAPPPDIHTSPKYFVDTLDQMEKNIGKIKEGDRYFLAYPFAENSYSGAQTAEYKADDKQISWRQKEFNLFDHVMASNQFSIDLEKGVGVLNHPSPIAGEKIWIPNEVANVQFQMLCRSITEVIEIKDLLTQD